MEAIKAEIERKKRELLESNVMEPNKKFFKRGQLITKQEEEYKSKYGLKSSEEEDVNKKTGNGTKLAADGNSDSSQLSRREVIRRLRERGEPILLFAESELDAFRRLRRCEILEPEVNKGFRNDFQEAMEKVEEDYLDEILASTTTDSSNDGSKSEDLKLVDNQLTYDHIQQMAANLGKGDRILDMEVTMQLLQFLLKMWGNQLNCRSSAEKMGTRGKMTLATFTQTQIYLKPLLRKLRSKSLPEDISDSLTEITRHLLDRNYIMASDSYLQMAIGNAPWPIGVTMVGIHARTGREKIFSKNVAHVLNDETQRKYIQALKRLMTKCQEFFPTDPSRCVEYCPQSTG
ncbi:pre-mRNA-splicing factor 18 isoform X2 [Nilaparvata lugens]|uniref:pre-mRNA-splicing factor 18 isoform X1 n=1 Tax=Nilaparvata lugens TaxID=108931 RepID=UPI000B986D2C|nr:pre-mRNA-splicing factor 18 isoform X1 [Nilaparvata lugens]XP_039298577.1 pre-mRNA-splicing factor 18 isoform X2 [Nilaparvata lugens]